MTNKVDMVDVTGTLRPSRDVEAALRWVKKKLMTMQMEIDEDGPVLSTHDHQRRP